MNARGGNSRDKQKEIALFPTSDLARSFNLIGAYTAF